MSKDDNTPPQQGEYQTPQTTDIPHIVNNDNYYMLLMARIRLCSRSIIDFTYCDSPEKFSGKFLGRVKVSGIDYRSSSSSCENSTTSITATTSIMLISKIDQL